MAPRSCKYILNWITALRQDPGGLFVFNNSKKVVVSGSQMRGTFDGVLFAGT